MTRKFHHLITVWGVIILSIFIVDFLTYLSLGRTGLIWAIKIEVAPFLIFIYYYLVLLFDLKMNKKCDEL